MVKVVYGACDRSGVGAHEPTTNWVIVVYWYGASS